MQSVSNVDKKITEKVCLILKTRQIKIFYYRGIVKTHAHSSIGSMYCVS